jgi:hypothetical protein
MQPVDIGNNNLEDVTVLLSPGVAEGPGAQ